MAVRTLCDKCQTSFSAQEELLGHRVKCPSCGAKIKLRLADEIRAELHRKDEQKEWQRQQEQRIELIERLDRQRRSDYAIMGLGTGPDRVRNFNPGAISRYRRLRALSSFLLLCAYLFVGLSLAGAAVTIHLHRIQLLADLGVLILALLGWLLLMLSGFGVFKFLGELCWILADIADHQVDARNLLLDARDDAERAWARSRAAPRGEEGFDP